MKNIELSEQTFVDYFVEKQKIETKNLTCISVEGWDFDGGIGRILVEYEHDDKNKLYLPIAMAKRFLKLKYGIDPISVRFHNPHYNRISCSGIFIEVSKNDYEKLIQYVDDKIEMKIEDDRFFAFILIHNNPQTNLCYDRELFKYYQ